MNPEHEPVFRTAFQKLLVSYRVPQTAELFESYADGLGDLSIQSILNAFAKAIRESERFPTIAELHRLANDGRHAPEFLRDQFVTIAQAEGREVPLLQPAQEESHEGRVITREEAREFVARLKAAIKREGHC